MSISTQPVSPQQRPVARRIWRTPNSKAWWLWLTFCILLYGGVLIWYFNAINTQKFPGPFFDPLRFFGIIAYVLVLGTATYSLRRRFVRNLPGKAQSWLWMHIWVGITAILIALLHENFTHITKDFCQNLTCFTQADWGTSALFALIFLVLSGIIGRLLDLWQTHIIAAEASSNGVGIVQALVERILELEYVVERLSAGKSEPFKQYCLLALDGRVGSVASPQQLTAREQADFQHADEILKTRARLVQSLHRQQRARRIIRIWRSIHIVLASLALLVILYHGTLELLTVVFHILKA